MDRLASFALIGAGRVAQSYAQAFKTCPEVQVAAVVDPQADAAQSLSHRLRCPAFADITKLLNSPLQVDAAVICTPPNTHEELTSVLLEQGIAVLCEKPFTLDSASALRLLAKASRTHTLLTMASKFRYVPDIFQAKTLLDRGLIGEPLVLENIFTARVDMAHRWNSDPAIAGGGVLIDNGTHAIDLMRFFLGPLTHVHAIESKRIQRLSVEDTVQLYARTASGAVGTSSLSWSIQKDNSHYLVLYGTEGCIQVGWQVSHYRLFGSKETTAFGVGYDKVQAFRDQILNFGKALRGIEPLRITSDDALASVQVIEAAYESMRQCQWTPVAGCRHPYTPNGNHRTGCLHREQNSDLGPRTHPTRLENRR